MALKWTKEGTNLKPGYSNSQFSVHWNCAMCILPGVSTHLLSVFVPDCSFKDVCAANTLKDSGSVSVQDKRQICFLTRVIFLPLGKMLGRLAISPLWDWGFLSSGFSAVTQTHSVCNIHLGLFVSPLWDLGNKRHWCKREALGPAVLWAVKSFVSDPGITCSLPISMAWRQPHLLAFKQGKSSDAPQLMSLWWCHLLASAVYFLFGSVFLDFNTFYCFLQTQSF